MRGPCGVEGGQVRGPCGVEGGQVRGPCGVEGGQVRGPCGVLCSTSTCSQVSGSAARLTGSASFHHFTLLLNTDIERLQRYLRKKEMWTHSHTHTHTHRHTQTHTHARTHTHTHTLPSLPQLNLTQKSATPSVVTSVTNLASSMDRLEFDTLCTAVATVMWQEHQVPLQDQKVGMGFSPVHCPGCRGVTIAERYSCCLLCTAECS